MTKKIGFDATSITKNHDGGKNQFSLNLLRGFAKNGVADRFVIFCASEMYEEILELTPNAAIVPIHFIKILHKGITKGIIENWVRTFILPRYLHRYNIGVFLFPVFNTSLRRYPIPTVVVPHDIQSQTNKERFFVITRLLDAFSYHFDFKLRDRIIAISNFDKHEIATTYPSCKDKIIQIYNPIFTDILMSAGIYKASNPYIVAINIQFTHKNTITLIKAFEKIKNIIPHDLYLVGNTIAETAYLVSYVHDYGLSNRIIFKGFLKDVELAEILKGSALYVNPSLFEGFGMTTVEAMLAEVPALVSNVAAVPEVTMGLCNYYEPPDNVDVLAEMMKKCLLKEAHTNTSQLKMISSQMDDKYNYVKIAHQYYDLLMSLMQKEDSGGN